MWKQKQGSLWNQSTWDCSWLIHAQNVNTQMEIYFLILYCEQNTDLLCLLWLLDIFSHTNLSAILIIRAAQCAAEGWSTT